MGRIHIEWENTESIGTAHSRTRACREFVHVCYAAEGETIYRSFTSLLWKNVTRYGYSHRILDFYRLYPLYYVVSIRQSTKQNFTVLLVWVRHGTVYRHKQWMI